MNLEQEAVGDLYELHLYSGINPFKPALYLCGSYIYSYLSTEIAIFIFMSSFPEQSLVVPYFPSNKAFYVQLPPN